MESILQFISEQSIIIAAILAVILLIVQEVLADKRGAQCPLSPEDAAVLLFKGAKLIDIRSKDVYQTGHIAGAVWHNPQHLSLHPEKTLRPQKTYIFVCDNGVQSGELANLLRQKNGYQTHYIQQGMTAWLAEGLKTTT